MKPLVAILIMLGLVPVTTLARPYPVMPGEKAPDFEATDSRGKQRSLAEFKGKYVVLEWVNHGCRYVLKHYSTSNMQTLQKDYGKKGVVWLTINSSAPGKEGHCTAAEANTFVADQGASPSAYLFDSSGQIGRRYGARTTPHVFVINPEGNLLYHGAIDDAASWDPGDIEDAVNFVALFLDADMANETVNSAEHVNRPYGTAIQYAK